MRQLLPVAERPRRHPMAVLGTRLRKGDVATPTPRLGTQQLTMTPEKTTPLLIDGEQVEGSAGTFATINPASEEPLGTAADGDSADMDRAVAAARRAFDESDWSRDAELRVHCLRQLRDALNAEIDLLRDITVAEVGAPISLTYGGQLQIPVDDLAFVADVTEKYLWITDLGVAAPLGVATRRTIAREPFGVVAAITPFNFPHQINLAKIGPALAAGNTVVVKPAPDTPWCAAEVARIAATKTDLPRGVLNVVTSSDPRIGAQLAEDPRVDLVSFTGSTATGRAVMTAAAQTIKKVLLELGGKSAFVVLDDADLVAACEKAAVAVARHAGQGCAFTSRLLVPRDRYDEAAAFLRPASLVLACSGGGRSTRLPCLATGLFAPTNLFATTGNGLPYPGRYCR